MGFGVIGLVGIGHIYLGRVNKGVILLVVSVLLGIVFQGSLLLALSDWDVTFGLALYAVLLWHIYDVYRLTSGSSTPRQKRQKSP